MYTFVLIHSIYSKMFLCHFTLSYMTVNFTLWTDGWIKQGFLRHHLGLWEIVMNILHYFPHCIDQTITQLIKNKCDTLVNDQCKR